MPSFRDLMDLANPPGTEAENLPTRRSRGRRYVPPAQVLGGFLRTCFPILRIGQWAVVTRREDVDEVLSRPDVFGVPFGEEMARLNDGSEPGTPFILGVDRKECHDAQLRQVMSAFRREDVRTKVVPLAARSAAEIVAAAGGRLETIAGLITAVPIEICRGYFGVPIADARAFATAARIVSGHLFGPPPIQPDKDVDPQADLVRQVVDAALRQSPSHIPPDTVLWRLLHMNELSHEERRAFLVGMIIGFVPTNTIAGGNILEMLLARKDFLAAARRAAMQGDDDLLGRCLFEALRFMPINFGPFRICRRDYVLAAGTWRAKKIRSGSIVLASTQSAMFDCQLVEHPFEFVPERPASDFMHFGFGMHWCVGAFIAQAQIVQTLKALLLKHGLDRAEGSEGHLKRIGRFPANLFGFPESLVVRYQDQP